MFHKIKNVKLFNDYILYVKFENDIVKKYDIKSLFDLWPVFRNLKEEGLFQLVKIDTGGYGVSWNDEIDLACDELWENGIQVNGEKEYGILSSLPTTTGQGFESPRELLNKITKSMFLDRRICFLALK